MNITSLLIIIGIQKYCSHIVSIAHSVTIHHDFINFIFSHYISCICCVTLFIIYGLLMVECSVLTKIKKSYIRMFCNDMY